MVPPLFTDRSHGQPQGVQELHPILLHDNGRPRRSLLSCHILWRRISVRCSGMYSQLRYVRLSPAGYSLYAVDSPAYDQQRNRCYSFPSQHLSHCIISIGNCQACQLSLHDNCQLHVTFHSKFLYYLLCQSCLFGNHWNIHNIQKRFGYLDSFLLYSPLYSTLPDAFS